MTPLRQRMIDAMVSRGFSPRTRKADFLFPVHALSKVFRAKFMAALACAHRDDCTPRDPQGQDALWLRVAQMDVLLCPCCKAGTLRVVAVLARQGRLPTPACTLLPQSRGPP